MTKLKSSAMLPAAMTIVMALISGCRTTEANYRNAYDTVVAHQREKASEDVAGMTANDTPVPKETTLSAGVTVPLYTTWISTSNEPDVAGRAEVQRYNITVARFRQVFNARQMLSRLRTSGYPEALMLKASDCYFVATATTSVPDSALILLRKVEADSTLRLRSPYPFVLRPGHFAR